MRSMLITVVLFSALATVPVAQGQGANEQSQVAPLFTDAADLGPHRVFVGKANDGRPAIHGRAHPSLNEPNNDRLLRNAVLAINGTNLRITADELAIDGEGLVLSGNVRITLNAGYRQN